MKRTEYNEEMRVNVKYTIDKISAAYYAWVAGSGPISKVKVPPAISVS